MAFVAESRWLSSVQWAESWLRVIAEAADIQQKESADLALESARVTAGFSRTPPSDGECLPSSLRNTPFTVEK